MMRSMFSGVSSLRVHQTRMDVIANNIANVNTIGFKSARATFTDAFYQNLRGASGPDGTTGRAGTNPQQIGLGLNMGSIDNIMTQGASQRTDNALDVMLAGSGFLIVQNPDGLFFTRAGNINEDRAGNLHINGNQLMGWTTRVNEVTGSHEVDRSSLVPLSLSGDKRNMPAEPTTVFEMVGNLGVSHLDDNNQVTRSMRIYDSLGHSYEVRIRFTYHENDNDVAHNYWTFEFLGPADGVVEAFRDGDRTNPSFLNMHVLPTRMPGPPAAEGGPVTADPTAFETRGTIAFNTRGEVVGVGPTGVDDDGNVVPIRFLEGNQISNSDPLPPHTDAGWVSATHPDVQRSFPMFIVPATTQNSNLDPLATFGDVGRNVAWYTDQDGVMYPVGTIRMDTSELFNREGNMTLQGFAYDGNPPGVLDEISIGGDGTIMGRFTNGRLRTLGQIPVAIFRNPPGLQRMGNNLWVPTANSGPFDGIGQIGNMQGGALEMSNVDLANEFTEMITTQRGFQAASRTITVSDEMLQELVNLRR